MSQQSTHIRVEGTCPLVWVIDGNRLRVTKKHCPYSTVHMIWIDRDEHHLGPVRGLIHEQAVERELVVALHHRALVVKQSVLQLTWSQLANDKGRKAMPTQLCLTITINIRQPYPSLFALSII